jgi:hypothetical protein
VSVSEEKRRIHEVAQLRLRARLFTGSNATGEAAEGAESWTRNLAPGVSFKQVEAAYSTDPTWREDLALPHSSAALTLNVFAPWQENLNKLCIGSISGFSTFEFEIAASVGLEGAPAYFDALGRSNERSVAIEVKCLEYLSQPSEKYRLGFEQSIRHICEAYGSSTKGWLGQANRLNDESNAYTALFAHQLVKQAFALEHQHNSGKHLLFYLFWEPVDWVKYSFFEHHRSELRQLCLAVADERIELQYQSINELLAAWAEVSRPSWLDDHVQYLKRRYELKIGENGRDLGVQDLR